MQPYQFDFIEFALQCGVLKFGEFTLKSGRISPYFFNAGLFCDGEAYTRLASFYAKVIYDHFIDHHDVLFGPAYKGISLATAASIGLKIHYHVNKAVSFNRKEIKDHGEGGQVIGSSLTGKKALLIDDVITAGTTVHESINLLSAAKGELIGIVIALDRQEKGLQSSMSALQEVEQKYNLKVRSLISLQDIIDYLTATPLAGSKQFLAKIRCYQAEYGIS